MRVRSTVGLSRLWVAPEQSVATRRAARHDSSRASQPMRLSTPAHATSGPPAASGGHLGAIGAAVRDAVRFDRRAVSLAGGLIAAVPVTAIFGIAIAAGDPVVAATMGAGSMLVAVAWRVGGGPPPLALLTVDAVLLALATVLGSVTGSRPALHIVVLFAWTLVVGLLVALGRRGAVVATQSVIGAVVFGRFAEPLSGALGLAGLVLAGGLATVLFVAVVRWPTPLKLQRQAVARVYAALAQLAASAPSASTLPAAARLDEARRALASRVLFDDAATLALQELVSEAARFRIELRAIHALIDQRVASSRVLRDDSSAAGTPERAAVLARLREVAHVLSALACVIETNSAPAAEHVEPTIAALEAPHSRAPDGVAATAAQPERAGRPPAAEPAQDATLPRRLAALEGQLRAMARLAPAAVGRPGPVGRRPHVRLALTGQTPRSDLALVRANATLRSPAGRHALRLAVVVALTELLSQHVPLQRSYWMVLAAATALRPEFATTFTRGAERILGTCLGVALASLIVVGVNPSLGAVVPIIGVLAWLAYSLFPASFAAGFAFLTALVVFLLDAVAPDTLATATDRLLDTLAGGAIGLAAYALWPTWSRASAAQALADVVNAQRGYLGAVLSAAASGEPIDQRHVAQLARGARLAYTTAQETVARSLAEPPSRRIDPAASQVTLAALRRLVGAIHVLRTELTGDGSREAWPEIGQLARDLDRALAIVAGALSTPDMPPSQLDLPPLRDLYTRLAKDSIHDPQRDVLLGELDEVIDATNTIAAAATAIASPVPEQQPAQGSQHGPSPSKI
jgi:uncharacterized membrane protein YccC